MLLTNERNMHNYHRPLFALCLTVFALLQCTIALAQEGSDIYLGKLNLWHKQPITELERLTDTEGYTNQPYFFGTDQLYFTQEVMQDSQSQMDIFAYRLSNRTILNVTKSAESEYSPTPLPAQNGMSVIRVNEAGKQELWSINLQGEAQRHLAPGIEPVGYQVWLNNEELLVFVLGEPNTLQRVRVDSEQTQGQVIDTNIGASLFQFERSDWFLYSKGDTQLSLKAYNAKTFETIDISPLPDGSRYFSVSSTGHVITSDGKVLYHRQLIAKGDKLRAEDNWEPIKISAGPCQTGISRTAISHFGDKIALVCPR